MPGDSGLCLSSAVSSLGASPALQLLCLRDRELVCTSLSSGLRYPGLPHSLLTLEYSGDSPGSLWPAGIPLAGPQMP